MSALTVFYQECPVCGRNLRVPVKYFGREMSCSHCEGTFLAGKDQMQPPACESAAKVTTYLRLTAGAAEAPSV
jgi:hypothetical protein